jgi:lipopolysaccharide transport system ATP-binding protein
MNNTVISIENLSKAYRLGQIGTGTLSRDINVWWAKVRGKPNPMLRLGLPDLGNRDGETIWALKDVSIKVDQGEALGIIGRNGAGKSTLLKILSQVTAPTNGTVKVKGRIASLLEVGTGFHPDLTGRENTYLNGAILGMTRLEIRRKLDEIVDFAEIKQFIDTPVKRYSSGMYVRLAFAVAAHLDPEILVVDEVLAVGDAEFQKKCLGKMSDVANTGRTVLFVSHNLAAIQNLCARSILLEHGQIILDDITEKTVSKYLDSGQEYNRFFPIKEQRMGDQNVKIENFLVSPNPPKTGQPIVFEVEIRRPDTFKSKINVEFSIGVKSVQNVPIFQVHSRHMGKDLSVGPGKSILRVSLESLPLAPGNYSISLWLGSGQVTMDWIKNCFTLSVGSGSFEKGVYVESQGYPVIAKSNWEII